MHRVLMVLSVALTTTTMSVGAGQADAPQNPSATALTPPGASRFVPIAPCRLLDTATRPPANAAEEMARRVDIKASRCSQIIPAYATAYSLRSTTYSRTAPEKLPPGVAPLQRTSTVPATAPLDFSVPSDSHIAVDVDGYYVAPGTPIGPVDTTTTGVSTPPLGVRAEAVQPHPGPPTVQQDVSGTSGNVYLDSPAELPASGILMKTTTTGRPWIVAKGSTSDGSSGFAVANSANTELMHVRSDGAVQLLSNAFFDGRTDFFGSPGSYFGYVSIPTNIIHDVTLVNPRDASNSNVNRVVFFNAQSDDEYGSPATTKFRASTFGYYAQLNVNFDSELRYHWGDQYHFRARSTYPTENKDTFWVKAATNQDSTTNTRADMYVSGNVGVGTTAPSKKLQVAGSMTLNNDTSTTSLNNAYFLFDGGAPGWSAHSYGSTLGFANGRYRTMLFAPDNADIAISTHAGGTVPASLASFTERVTVQGSTGNVGIGVSNPQYRLDVAGDINISGNINAKYQDVAEWVPATSDMTPGTVVVLNPWETQRGHAVGHRVRHSGCRRRLRTAGAPPRRRLAVQGNDRHHRSCVRACHRRERCNRRRRPPRDQQRIGYGHAFRADRCRRGQDSPSRYSDRQGPRATAAWRR
ncbi:MAG: hypothetical protein AABO58_25130 [Acidobacteriota bacterium]